MNDNEGWKLGQWVLVIELNMYEPMASWCGWKLSTVYECKQRTYNYNVS